MFERTRVDSMIQSQSVPVPVELTLDDHSIIKGDLLVPQSRPVHEVLNGPAVFVEFRSYGMEPALVAKSAIRGIRFVKVPGVTNLRGTATSNDGFDPHQTLGVPVTATYEEIHRAYVSLAKKYHPDRYATADLPPEVSDYLAGMARRINLAFQALQGANRAATRRVAAVNEPVYTSGRRA